MSVFALSHFCVVASLPPSSSSSSYFRPLFAASDSHLGRRANKQLLFFMPRCFSVSKTRKHAGAHSHATTTPTIGSAPDTSINPPEPSSVEWLRWVPGEKFCLYRRDNQVHKHRLNSCLYTHLSLFCCLIAILVWSESKLLATENEKWIACTAA